MGVMNDRGVAIDIKVRPLTDSDKLLTTPPPECDPALASPPPAVDAKNSPSLLTCGFTLAWDWPPGIREEHIYAFEVWRWHNGSWDWVGNTAKLKYCERDFFSVAGLVAGQYYGFRVKAVAHSSGFWLWSELVGGYASGKEVVNLHLPFSSEQRPPPVEPVCGDLRFRAQAGEVEECAHSRGTPVNFEAFTRSLAVKMFDQMNESGVYEDYGEVAESRVRARIYRYGLASLWDEDEFTVDDARSVALGLVGYAMLAYLAHYAGDSSKASDFASIVETQAGELVSDFCNWVSSKKAGG